MNPDIRSILTDHSLRVTAPRMAVFEVLANANSPLSISDIVKARLEINKVSIYRTIELFSRIGVIVTVPHGWKQRYELAAPFKPHHHHIHCTKCGKIVEISSDKVESIVDSIGKAYHFYPTAHTFEISGLCRKCMLHAEQANHEAHNHNTSNQHGSLDRTDLPWLFVNVGNNITCRDIDKEPSR